MAVALRLTDAMAVKKSAKINPLQHAIQHRCSAIFPVMAIEWQL